MTTRGGPQHIPRPPGATPGPPAPWAHGHAPTLSTIRSALAAGPAPKASPSEAQSHPHTASAVLAPLYEVDGEVWVVLTRRSWQLRSHTGEVSFPGGRQEAGDVDLWDTATREAMEEVALDPADVERIGELDHLATVTSQSFIVPYVGVLRGRPDLVANDDEVDAILHVRLAELLDPDVYRAEKWSWEGIERTIHFFELVGDTIWGATGSMLVDLLRRISPR